MIKIKTNIHTAFMERLVFVVACGLTFCVLLLSLHAKDIITYQTSERNDIKYQDLSHKTSTDIHNHVEKQFVKTFPSLHDGSLIVARHRDDIDMATDGTPSFWARISEQFHLWGVYLTLPFSRLVS